MLQQKDGKIISSSTIWALARQRIDVKNEGMKFNFDKSFYVDDAAFIFLSRDDIKIKRRKTNSISFQKVWPYRTRGKQNKEGWQIKNGSNVFPGAGRKEDATTIDKEADIMIREQEFYSYTKKFKYLGSICTPSLKDDEDIKRRISQACGAFAQAEKLLCNHKLQAITRIRFYEASV